MQKSKLVAHAFSVSHSRSHFLCLSFREYIWRADADADAESCPHCYPVYHA